MACVSAYISTAAGMAKHCMSARCMSAGHTSAAMATWMAGSYRVRCHRHATKRDRSSESDECFMTHVILLLRLKQKISCEDKNNAGSLRKVASRADTFACA
jgi:hypothetical protein